MGALPSLTWGSTGSSTTAEQNEVVHLYTAAIYQLDQYIDYSSTPGITLNFGSSSLNIASSSATMTGGFSNKGVAIEIPTGGGITTFDHTSFEALRPQQKFWAIQHEAATILLGLTGFLDPTTGSLASGFSVPSGYDTFCVWNSGTPYFDSYETRAITMGNTVPTHMPSGIIQEQLYRISAPVPGADGYLDIMNPQTNNFVTGVSAIDLAMGCAAGAPITDPRIFNSAYYLSANTDVAGAWFGSSFGFSLWDHYQNNGWKEHRNPSAFFNGDGYLSANSDVASANVCPLIHFSQNGYKEGRGGY